MVLLRRLDDLGYEKTRRAVAALPLAFFLTLYLLISLNAPEGWGPAFLALAACYLVAFVALVAEWFWGRWFASGLGWSGLMVALISVVMIGYSPPLIIYGVLHGLVVASLLGKRMVALYDMQEGWRQRYGMDEYGVARLRKTVTRASASLPSLILWALAPKDPGQGGLAQGLLTALLAGGAVVGLGAVMLRLRSWGLMAMALAAVGLVIQQALHPLLPSAGAWQLLTGASTSRMLAGAPGLVLLSTIAFAGAVLVTAVAPFVGPAARFLRRR